MSPLPGPVIIGGCPRSGTTLLRVMLDSHTHVVCGPESKFIPHVAEQWLSTAESFGPILQATLGTPDVELARAYGAVIRGVLDGVRRRSGKPVVAEKTPQNVLAFTRLQWMLPDARFVHVIRDGRDVVCSLLDQDWTDAMTGEPIDYTADPAKAATAWVGFVQAGRQMRGQPGASRYHEVRYEALVAEPEATMRALCGFLGLPWDPAVLAHHARTHTLGRNEASSRAVRMPLHRGSAGRFARDLGPEDRATVESIAGPLLRELGYAS